MSPVTMQRMLAPDPEDPLQINKCREHSYSQVSQAESREESPSDLEFLKATVQQVPGKKGTRIGISICFPTILKKHHHHQLPQHRKGLCLRKGGVGVVHGLTH